MAKIFMTGATGYIGGDFLHLVSKAHPEYSVTAIVRDSSKGAPVAAAYPKVRLVYGDLDSVDLIREESAKADIVCHFANCDHEPSATAIVQGLAEGHSVEKPGFYVHTSGTGILEVDDLIAKAYGVEGSKVYDDWDGIDKVTSLPDQAWHRNVDKIVLAASTETSSKGKVKTAIVCPPTIYGVGRGPVKTHSDQWPRMAQAVLKRGKGFMVGEGKNKWTHIHVHDLSNLYLRLVEEAAKGGGDATWDDKGYYFSESGEYVWGEMAAKIAAEAKKQGLIEKDGVDSISKDDADQMTPGGSAKWGMNSRCKAIRGGKLLGWKPVAPSPEEELPGLVQYAAKELGIVKGHAAKAAGDA
jgi:nucleoside-diphosphate-sugar epimerase